MSAQRRYETTSADLIAVEYDNYDDNKTVRRELTPNPEPPDDPYVWKLVSSVVHEDRVLWFWECQS